MGNSAKGNSGAQVDVAADGFWGRSRERTFLDICVFNPFAPFNRQTSISATYRSHERVKKRQYCERICEIEHGTFSPLVFSLTGGMAKEAAVFYKRLASLLSERWEQPYSMMMGWLWCTLGFSLLRSSIQYLQGALSSIHQPAHCLPVDVIQSETHFPLQ